MIDARPRFYVLLSAMLLAAAWLVTPGLKVPIYDGIGAPDEPYRFIDPPAGYRRTTPPTIARGELSVSNGKSAESTINSAESGPQVSLFFPGGALRPTSGSGPVTVTAAPVRAPAPAHGYFWSNVYHVAARSGAGNVALVTSGAQIQLRAPNAAQPGPTLEVLDGTTWHALKTYRTGNDVYAGSLSQLGDFALVNKQPIDLNGSQDTSSDAAVGPIGLAIALGGVFVAVVLFIRAERSRTRRRRERLEAR